jgi:hypothetical protein
VHSSDTVMVVRDQTHDIFTDHLIFKVTIP